MPRTPTGKAADPLYVPEVGTQKTAHAPLPLSSAFCPTFPTPICKAKLKASFLKKILFQEKRKTVRQLHLVALTQTSIKRQRQKEIQPWTGGGHLALVSA